MPKIISNGGRKNNEMLFGACAAPPREMPTQRRLRQFFLQLFARPFTALAVV